MSVSRIVRYQWMAFLAVFAGLYFSLDMLFNSAVDDARLAAVLGQGSASAASSTLESSSVMPLVSVEAKKSATPVEEAVDDQLFYKVEPEVVKPVEVVVKPKIDARAELQKAVSLQSIVGAGAVLNGKFLQKGDLITKVRNADGEMVNAILVSVGADFVVVGAQGETLRISL
jgi:hypothetical protein